MDDEFCNRVGHERISDRQIDELIGMARMIMVDGKIDDVEVKTLQYWLSSNLHITKNPLVRTLYQRINEILHDGIIDKEEKDDLFDTLSKFANRDLEMGEALKATTLPLCNPPPAIHYAEQRFCFTGTFVFGCRKACEQAVAKRGGVAGSLTKNTNFLVIGTYATDSWKHSSFGNKILKACELKERGHAISIVSEKQWHESL